MLREETKNALISFLEDRKNLDVAGNSLLVFQNDQELFRHYTGDVSKDTIFRIYSMTKLFTVVSALQLMELGKFTMEDPVSMYLPEYETIHVWDEKLGKSVLAENAIRIRDLFCMSSGLTYGGDWGVTPKQISNLQIELEKEYPGESYTTQQFARALAKVDFAFQPGTRWAYGLSHDVLGAVIEVISGQTLGEYMKEHIFDPLGMKHTFFRLPSEYKEQLATHSADPSEDAKFKEQARYESGGGGLLSTLDDYMKFANTLTRGGISADGVRILGRKTIDLLRMDQLNEAQKADFNWDYLKGYSYGLGVRTMVDPAQSGIPGSVGEFGWCGVLGTWVLIDPAEKLTVVYMHQRYPNLEKYVQTHLRSMIYGGIE